MNPEGVGTKAACHYRLEIPAGGAVTLQLRLTADAEAAGPDPSRVFTDRIREADAFYARHIPGTLGEGEQAVVRQAYASLLWSKKFYHYVVKDWLEGDPAQPPPPPSRRDGRNH
ncbi:MAG: glucosidase, partial [Deltaproteobacteria bacterium]